MKITIIGGGTAGWLSALYFISRNIRTDKKTGKVINENIWDITVIDTDKVPIIGAGEGSTGLLADAVALRLKHIPEITEWDFLTKTESTLKLGIRFKDWNGIGTEFQESFLILKLRHLPISQLNLHLPLLWELYQYQLQ